MAWAYEVGLRSLCQMSWPAAKVTIITVASVKTQMCKNHLLGWYTWDTNYFVVIVHGVDHKKLPILFYGYDHVHIPRNNLTKLQNFNTRFNTFLAMGAILS